MNERLITVENLIAKVKLNNGDELITVNNISLEFFSGKSYAIVGKSGSGKTSLVSIIGLLNSSFKGDFKYRDITIKNLKDKELSILRGQKIGFVFQNYSLIKHLNVWENIELSLFYSKKKLDKNEHREMIENVLSMVGLSDRKDDYPNNLSGGEQQRVAIARALVTNPEILICDEPTGALDKHTGKMVMELLLKVVREKKATLILVTHDKDIANNCDIVMTMDGGEIVDVSDGI
ncbi:TPA: ABC transporter ATP-binding protein [Streptococcus equi subsp. zooepidemicus]|nr:ABC transporter ATP-binding protein [Streptococcus equi subsp. zooepidemicus]